MSDQNDFEKWFARCRGVELAAVKACRYMQGYISDCIRMSGIEIAWAAWQESKKPH